MRLGQLSRQIEVLPEQIITYLEKQGVIIKKHPNAKINDEFINKIIKHFKTIEKTTDQIVESTSKKEKKKEIIEDQLSPINKPEEIETVKPAPIPVPKIIGKIDLPDKTKINVEVDGVVYDMETLETKKKENLKEEREHKLAEKEAKEKAEKEVKEQLRLKREEQKARKEKIEAERIEKRLKEKEKQRAIQLKKEEKERKELEKRRKEKQKEYYRQKFKPTSKGNKSKKVASSDPVENIVSPIIELQQEVKEKSLYKRFIKWLNT